METEKLGIKETKEVMTAMNELSLYLISKFKDGFQVADVTSIVSDMIAGHELKELLSKAGENVKSVPAELKDMDVYESVELVMLQASYVPKIKDALSK